MAIEMNEAYVPKRAHRGVLETILSRHDDYKMRLGGHGGG